MALTFWPDPSPADWLTAVDAENLIDLGPAGFAAYARVRFLPDPAFEGQRENDAPIKDGGPSESAQLRTVLDVLARHTTTAGDCFFCLWDGWGWEVIDLDGRWTLHRDVLPRVDDAPVAEGPPPPDAVPAALPRPARPQQPALPPKVVVPLRAYYLFRGALTDHDTWSGPRTGSFPPVELPAPAFVWPADRAWCLANDVDPHWAGVGASAAAIDALLATPGLDVVRADPDQTLPYYC